MCGFGDVYALTKLTPIIYKMADFQPLLTFIMRNIWETVLDN